MLSTAFIADVIEYLAWLGMIKSIDVIWGFNQLIPGTQYNPGMAEGRNNIVLHLKAIAETLLSGLFQNFTQEGQ